MPNCAFNFGHFHLRATRLISLASCTTLGLTICYHFCLRSSRSPFSYSFISFSFISFLFFWRRLDNLALLPRLPNGPPLLAYMCVHVRACCVCVVVVVCGFCVRVSSSTVWVCVSCSRRTRTRQRLRVSA